jgi:hypothetical protein
MEKKKIEAFASKWILLQYTSHFFFFPRTKEILHIFFHCLLLTLCCAWFCLALFGSGIKVIVDLPNKLLFATARSKSFASTWIELKGGFGWWVMIGEWEPPLSKALGG